MEKVNSGENWEMSYLYNRYPEGCPKGCHCVHPADDCACDHCQSRHAYQFVELNGFKDMQTIRLN